MPGTADKTRIQALADAARCTCGHSEGWHRYGLKKQHEGGACTFPGCSCKKLGFSIAEIQRKSNAERDLRAEREARRGH